MRTKTSPYSLLVAVIGILGASVLALGGVATGQTGAYCQGVNVTTRDATDVTDTSARLNGTIDPQGKTVTYQFQYGTSDTYGQTTPERTVGGSGPQSVSELVSGLTPGATYNFRLVVTQPSACQGDNRQFTTTNTGQQNEGPVVATGDARDVTGTSATLTGAIIPGAQPVQYAFAYGTSTSYGQASTLRSAPAGQSGIAVSESVGGLQPGTLYHFQLMAVNESGQAGAGGDRTFSTVAVRTGKVRPRGVTSRVKPRRDATEPYRYRVSGRVRLPAGVSSTHAGAAQAATCSGRVRIRIKQGRRNRTRGKGSARVKPNCRYSKRVRARPKPVSRVRGRLKVRIRYMGNAQLKQRRARTRTVFFGPRRR